MLTRNIYHQRMMHPSEPFYIYSAIWLELEQIIYPGTFPSILRKVRKINVIIFFPFFFFSVINFL